MRIVSATLRNFRCFEALSLDIDKPIVLVIGPNGSGKTTLLEALHYMCYLSSFKTHVPRELMRLNSSAFAISLQLASNLAFDSLQVTYTRTKKAIKLNEATVTSYKQLYGVYKAITIVEGDLLIIQGSPSARRAFIDDVILLVDPSYGGLLRKYKQVLANRNALLALTTIDRDSYRVWTEQLFKLTQLIHEQRLKLLSYVQEAVSSLMGSLGDDGSSVVLSYEYTRPYGNVSHIGSSEALFDKYPLLLQQEQAYKRSLFGAHLDDIAISFQGKSARIYASRGQQKLLVFLLKMAHLKIVTQQAFHTQKAIALVDDFVTDFDEKRVEQLLALLRELASQIIITSPVEQGILREKLSIFDIQVVHLPS